MRRLSWMILPALAVLLAAAGEPAPPESERFVPGRRSGLVNDGAEGCWLWVGGISEGVRDMRASWTGGCTEGRASGKGRSEITWRDGDLARSMIYEGVLEGGRAEGQGRLTHTTNGRVVAVETGEYRNDRFVGGRFEVPGQVIYEGGWGLQGPQGQGRVVIQGRRFEGEWQAGCLRVQNNWVSFTRPPQDCEGAPT